MANDAMIGREIRPQPSDAVVVDVRGAGLDQEAELSDGRVLKQTGTIITLQHESGDVRTVHECPEVVDQYGRLYALMTFCDDNSFSLLPLTGDEA